MENRPGYVFDVKDESYAREAAIAYLHEHGFIVLRNLFAPETLDYVIRRTGEVLAMPSIAGSFGYYRKDYHKRLFEPLLFGGPTVDLIVNGEALGLIEDYLDGECVLAELYLKYDRGTNEVYFDLHADFWVGFSNHDRDSVTLTSSDMANPLGVGALIYLHDTTEGAFCFCEKSHTLGAKHGSDPANYPSDERKAIVDARVRVDGKCGDLVLFDDRGFHGPEQPTKVNRTVLVFDFYKVGVFGHDTKVPVPLFLNDVAHLDPHQLRVLGLGAGTMIPYEKFHIRQFNKSPAYPYIKLMLDASFALQHGLRRWRGRAGRLKRRILGAR